MSKRFFIKDTENQIKYPVTKAEFVEDLDKFIGDATENLATTEYVDTELEKKADKATTLADYGIADAYTKTEIDAAINAIEMPTVPTKVSELENDFKYQTEDEVKAAVKEVDDKVTENATAIAELKGSFETMMGTSSEEVTEAIDTFNEVKDFLATVTNEETLAGMLTAVESKITTETTRAEAAEKALGERIDTVESTLNTKANSDDVYTKEEVDTKVNTSTAAVDALIGETETDKLPEGLDTILALAKAVKQLQAQLGNITFEEVDDTLVEE